MKKLLVFMFLLSLYSCSKEEPVNPAKEWVVGVKVHAWNAEDADSERHVVIYIGRPAAMKRVCDTFVRGTFRFEYPTKYEQVQCAVRVFNKDALYNSITVYANRRWKVHRGSDCPDISYEVNADMDVQTVKDDEYYEKYPEENEGNYDPSLFPWEDIGVK